MKTRVKNKRKFKTCNLQLSAFFQNVKRFLPLFLLISQHLFIYVNVSWAL